MENNVQIERRSQVLDVIQIVFQFHDGVLHRIAVFMIDLGPTGDAGFHAQAMTIVGDFFFQDFDKLRPFRTRTHQRHFAAHHVQQLRQFIQSRFTQEAAQRRHARIVFGGPHRPADSFGILAHGAELVQPEGFAVHPQTDLRIEHRARRGQAHQQRDEAHHRCGDNYGGQAKHQGVDGL